MDLLDRSCPECSSIMKIRNGPHGKFFGCIRFPACRGTRHIDTLQANTPDPTAGDELKKLRMTGHRKFKEFCEKMNRTKRSAYRTMAKHMKIPMEKAHFGMFNENKCREAIALFDRLMNV